MRTVLIGIARIVAMSLDKEELKPSGGGSSGFCFGDWCC